MHLSAGHCFDMVRRSYLQNLSCDLQIYGHPTFSVTKLGYDCHAHVALSLSDFTAFHFYSICFI